MIATNIDDLVARLQQQEAAVGAAHKALNENAARAQAAFHATEQQLGLVIRGLSSGPREIDAEQALNAELEERRAMLLTKQTEQQIADAPDWQTLPTSRDRDAEYDRQQHLNLQLRLLHEGRLLSGPQQVYPRMEDLDARLKKSTERIEKLRAELAASLQQAEELLADPVTQ